METHPNSSASEIDKDDNGQLPTAVAWGPASLSNLGPGFDVLGVSIRGMGDRVRVSLSRKRGCTVRVLGPEWVSQVPANEELNTAAVAARRVLASAGLNEGVEITICKGIPLGSGVGGSAASAVAGAVAAAAVVRMETGESVPLGTVTQSALYGERVASGALHGDNVIPSLVGGMCLVDPTDPNNFTRLDLLIDCEIVLLLPPTRVLTKTARAVLPDTVQLSSTSAQAYRLATMLDALSVQDWDRAGNAMMSDELVEPYRSTQVSSFQVVRKEAIAAGAFACGLSGSGPAMFALIAPGGADSTTVGQAMLAPFRNQNKTARVLCTRVDRRGTRIVEPSEPLVV